jgi:hypothetical protein
MQAALIIYRADATKNMTNFDRSAIWIDDLQPAFGEPQFFFDKSRYETTMIC